jgi:hypothetical protein
MDERGKTGIPRFDLDKGLEALERNGGVTFAPDGSVAELSAGFAVGGRVPSVVIEKGITGSGLRTAITMALVSVGRKTWTTFGYTGVWRDDDKVYVDAVDVETTLEAALALARKRGEKAIFDFASKKAINV